MKIKTFFQKKYIIFYLSIIAFVLLLVATLVIGFKSKISGEVTTLTDLPTLIANTYPKPRHLINSYALMIAGLITSGIAIVLLFVNLIEIKKIQNQHQDSIWWLGIIFVLVAFILILSGEGLFANEQTKLNKPLKFEDLFDVGRFSGLILAIVVMPLATFIAGAVWYPKFPQSKPATEQSLPGTKD